jgi:hypothetical protein
MLQKIEKESRKRGGFAGEIASSRGFKSPLQRISPILQLQNQLEPSQLKNVLCLTPQN